MKTLKKYFVRNLVPILVLFIASCSSDSDEVNPDPGPDPVGETLAEVIASGDAFEDFPPSTTEMEVPDTETTQNEPFDRRDSTNLSVTIQQRWICTEKEVDITGGSHTFPLYNPNASVIWPGNLLQGKTLGDATPRDVVVKRAGGTITYDLVNGNATATRSVDVIDQGSVQQAMNDIIAGSGDAPARFILDVVAINSKEQLALEMGLSVSSFTTKVDSDFSYNSSGSVSSVLVKLTQQYYTMSYVKPTSLEEVFDPSVTPEQLAAFVQPDNPATFISSVTYGRIFYMLYESSASAQDMEATLRGSYNAVAGEASAEVSINKLREYNNLKVKVIAYGGDSEGTLEAVGSVFAGDEAVDNLKDIVDRLAFAGNIETGLPLSYVVNSLEDPSQVVSTNLATRYTVKNCEYKGILPPQGLMALVDLFSEDEDGGGIGAMAHVADSNVLVFNKEGTEYAWYNGNSGEVKAIFDIKDANSPLGVVPLDDVGAAVQLSDSRIYLFDKTGLLNSRLDYRRNNSANATNGSAPTTPIGSYTSGGDGGNENIFLVNNGFGDSGNFQFAGRGFVAASRQGANTSAFFAGAQGDEYARYDITNGGVWGNPLDNSTWWDQNGLVNGSPELFTKVGASTYIEFGGSSGRWYFVNDKGDELMQYFSQPNRKFEGPWVIN